MGNQVSFLQDLAGIIKKQQGAAHAAHVRICSAGTMFGACRLDLKLLHSPDSLVQSRASRLRTPAS